MNNALFTQTYKSYWRQIYSFLMKKTCFDIELSKDLCQQTFLSCLLNFNQFDTKRNLLSWLFGIASHKLLDYQRHLFLEKDYNEQPDSYLDSMGSRFDTPEQIIAEQELKYYLEKAIDKLNDEQKEVFLLRQNELPFKEIARIQNSNINTVLARMRQAKFKLKKELKKCYLSMN
jgi:RNA polymerase sigma-70 factor, ECF subfamily